MVFGCIFFFFVYFVTVGALSVFSCLVECTGQGLLGDLECQIRLFLVCRSMVLWWRLPAHRIVQVVHFGFSMKGSCGLGARTGLRCVPVGKI